MGLLEDDSKEEDFEEGKVTEESTRTGKNRGVLLSIARQTCKLDERQFHFVLFSFFAFFFLFSFFTVSDSSCLCSDNSDRAFYKELVEVIEASDVILEVLDARNPLGTRCVDMEKMVMQSGPDKHLVLLLNKIGTALS